MDEVASAPIVAISILQKSNAFFCLVLYVSGVVFSELVVTVGKLAFLLVRAVSELCEFLAEL